MIRGKTTKEELTKKDASRKSNFLACLMNTPPNFNGGNQWLTKLQYDLYLQFCKEAIEGRVKENTDAHVMDLFHRQQKLKDVENTEMI
jgi:hypothetical protein